MNDWNDELGTMDTSGLTDADWAEINKLRRAWETEGTKALTKKVLELDQCHADGFF
jgi:hypothetical protein